MHYNTEYTGMTDIEKQRQAVKDVKEYLGPKKFYELDSKFRAAGKIDAGQFEFICMVGGIEGYPVEAWYKFIYGEKK